jgi:3-oxoacyl-[acyl-carrier-protein] synthase III|uniref:Uncharacterized protein n=1 Tax=Siphoviridae sp. ctbQZ1 TaxID=2827581 RepID=A0A8S5LN93_9CAUD|nr:MAG TPA: hypothetical protein [Siphoviridae sp. ctbQZ1]
MRVISQDGTIDMPYEMSTMWCDDAGAVLLQPIGEIGEYQTFAKYSTGEKAKKAMEMLRIAYENNEFYHHTANSEHFTEFSQALSEEMFKKATTEYFQFPAEEELE